MTSKKTTVSFIIVLAAVLLVLNFYTRSDISLEPITTINRVQQVEILHGTYIGETINNTFHGIGEFHFLTGEKYTGLWSDGIIIGEGLLVFPGVGQYQGGFDNNNRSGEGIFTWEDGSVYNGLWANDLMTGNGTYTHYNGVQIIGTFAGNKINNGVLIYEPDEQNLNADSIVYWSFEIIDNKFSGNVEFKTTSGVIFNWSSDIRDGSFTGNVEFSTSSGLLYRGEFPALDTIVHANIIYSDGSSYSGSLLNNQRSGHGEFTWFTSSGTIDAIYRGQWLEDLMHGEGVYWYSSSGYPRIEGEFEKGYPTGIAVYHQSSSFSYNTTWQDGICIRIVER